MESRWEMKPWIIKIQQEAAAHPTVAVAGASCWKANTWASLKMTHILHMAEDTAGEGTTFWPGATLTRAWPPLKYEKSSLQWAPAKTPAINMSCFHRSKKPVPECGRRQTRAGCGICFLMKSQDPATSSDSDLEAPPDIRVPLLFENRLCQLFSTSLF